MLSDWDALVVSEMKVCWPFDCKFVGFGGPLREGNCPGMVLVVVLPLPVIVVVIVLPVLVVATNFKVSEELSVLPSLSGVVLLSGRVLLEFTSRYI